MSIYNGLAYVATGNAGLAVVNYLSGDTALHQDMKLYGDEGVDLFVVPIGDNFTMGPEDAFRAVQFVEAKLVVPCHYGSWPLVDQDAESWARRVEGETRSRVKVLAPGESLEI